CPAARPFDGRCAPAEALFDAITRGAPCARVGRRRLAAGRGAGAAGRGTRSGTRERGHVTGRERGRGAGRWRIAEAAWKTVSSGHHPSEEGDAVSACLRLGRPLAASEPRRTAGRQPAAIPTQPTGRPRGADAPRRARYAAWRP